MTQKHSKQNVDEQKSKETESCTAAAATLQSYKHLYVHWDHLTFEWRSKKYEYKGVWVAMIDS